MVASALVRRGTDRVAAIRAALRLGVLGGCAGLAGFIISSVAILPDFIQYWTAGRLNLEGRNPYSPDLMWALQQALRPDQYEVIMMWNPPWTLALVMPLGLLDFETAKWVWVSMHLFILLVCTQWLWHFFGGRELGAWVASAVCILFPAAFYALAMGQISLLLLLGLCGFLFCERRRAWLAAGAFASLTLVKPHWLYLFWIALLVWSVSRRQWRILLGAILSTGAALAVALATNPSVIGQYVSALHSYPPDYFVAPTAGVLSRVLLGWENSWPQFVPTILGALWFLLYWRKHRPDWVWAETLSPIILVSALTAIYGWNFDQVVFLVPAVWMATQFVRDRSIAVGVGLACYLGASVLLVRMAPLPLFLVEAEPRPELLYVLLDQPNGFWQIVLAPIFVAGFAIAARGVNRVTERGTAPDATTRL